MPKKAICESMHKWDAMTIQMLYDYNYTNDYTNALCPCFKFFHKFYIKLCSNDDRHILPVKFLPKYYFDKLCFQLLQNVLWANVTRTSSGINGF